MCGIAGYAFARDRAGGSSGRVEESTLAAMAEALRHRGPDGGGIHIAGTAGLAVRRLAIVDRPGGAQPFLSQDSTRALVFNGEIYNHRELRRELEAAGARFRTSHADGEVLLEGLAIWGLDELLRRAVGMFAFAHWDERIRELTLARDRFGEKPLVYAHTRDAIAFASEAKALRPLDFWSRRLDRDALVDYLTLQYVPDPATIYEGLRKLPPAHWLRWSADTGAMTTGRYWSPRRQVLSGITAAEAADEVRSLLSNSVRQCLADEVATGVFLSGGIDSGALAALSGEAPLYTIAVDGSPAGDAAGAAQLAAQLGRRHELVPFGANPASLLPALAWQLDEPFGDPALLPLAALCRVAGRRITVALSGDGADEVFGGYARYSDFAPVPRWSALPRWVRSAAAGPLGLLARGVGPASVLAVAAEVNRVSLLPVQQRRLEGVTWTSRGLLAEILRHPSRRDTRADLLLARLDDPHSVDAVRRLDFETYLPGALMTKSDRAGMAVGLEVRSPFLDHRLMEFVDSLPSAIARPAGAPRKALLRAAMRGVLPWETLARRKAGFETPFGAWLRGPLRGPARDLLLDRTARGRGIFRTAIVERLLDAHLRGLADFKRPLWLMLQFELWARHAANPPGDI